MSREIDISLDGVDRDNPEARPTERRTWLDRSDWLACQNLVADLAELRQMSEADRKHYAEIPSFSQKSKSRGVNGYR